MTLNGRPLIEGQAEAKALVLGAPLNLWTGLDPPSGCIVEKGHPQEGATLSHRIVVISGIHGATAGDSLTECLRLGTGPVGLVLLKADLTIIVSVLVARELYNVSCPIILVSQGVATWLKTDQRLTLNVDGSIMVAAPTEACREGRA